MLSKLKGVIFDLDGTIIDSMGIWEKIDREFLERRNIPEDSEYMAALKNMNYSKAADYTIKRFQLKETPDMLMQEWDQMAEWEYGNAIPLKPGVKEFIAEIKSHGARIALATASGPNLYNAALKHHGLDPYFDAYTDVSVGLRGKDFPDIYLQAAKMLHVSPESCIVFEDLLMGIKVASSVGFVTCAVEDNSSVKDREALMTAADYYVKDFLEAAELLRERW